MKACSPQGKRWRCHRLALALVPMLAACSPAASVDIEVVDATGQPSKGAALSVHDSLSFKFMATANAEGCIYARGTPTRAGGRDWRMNVQSPFHQPARFQMHASGRRAYIVTLQPEGAELASSVQEVGQLERCCR